VVVQLCKYIALKAGAGLKQEQHPGAFARSAVRCSCGMLSPDPWARLQAE
jgi:hypothetical protein